MEKKSTKIAYFVALGVVVILLVILGISFKDAPLPTFEVDGEMVEAATPFAGTFWSLLPPIVAIILALISKEVYSSLSLGCLVGALLMCLCIGYGIGPKVVDDEACLEGQSFKSKVFFNICVKFITPIAMLLVLYGQIEAFFF